MSKLLCKGVQKLLGEWSFEAALLSNQNVLPCVKYVGGKLWVSTNHKRYQKNVRLFFVQILLGMSKVGRTEWIYQFKDKQADDRLFFIMPER